MPCIPLTAFDRSLRRVVAGPGFDRRLRRPTEFNPDLGIPHADLRLLLHLHRGGHPRRRGRRERLRRRCRRAILFPLALPLFLVLEILGLLLDGEARHRVGDVLLPLRGLDAALVGKLLAVVRVAVDDGGEVVVELAARVQVRDDFFVFLVGGFEALQGLFAVSGRGGGGGGVAFAGEEEVLV